MAEHTQTPWYAMASGDCDWVVMAGGTPIADMTTPTLAMLEPNARFIVRAVNCHKELVEALEDAIKLINDMNGCHGCADNSADEDNSRRNAVAAALAKAKEGALDESQMLLQDLDEETL